MKILGIIPARFASVRFPGKPLADIGGKSMIQRVYEQCLKSSILSKVIVATDDQRIYNHVLGFGGSVVMTSANHPSGTDRCFEAFKKIKGDFSFVINIQGDEPLISPEQIDLLASCLNSGETEIATLVKKINDEETLFNPNIPKVIFNSNKEAIYFSRQTIPFVRESEKAEWLDKHEFYKHIGIYAYRHDILEKISSLKPSSLEKAEKLEQLRWLESGFKIKIAITEFESQGIDTPEDLEKVLRLIGR
jgi:3-deoxy-manno-octulosonate cytidylyltransferase (CMP-KDO synthetase)